jgi:branched-chain amino acid transport system substrate-binding protein
MTGLAAVTLLIAACGGAAIDDGDIDDAALDGDAESTPDGDAEATEGTVTVGLINPITGPFAALGEDVNAGFQMYVDEQGGTLAGFEVQILSEDTANDTAVAIEGVERMLDRGADVLVGFVNSGVTYGASEVIRESGVPLIITTAGADDLTQRNAADNIFRVSYTSSQDSMPLGDYACNELGYESVAMIGLDYAFGWEAAAGFAMAYEDAGCEIVQELYAPLDTPDWAPFVQQIDRSADAVWAVIAGADAIRFLRSYDDFGVGLPLIGHGSTTDEQVLDEQREFAEGVVTSLHYSGVIESEINERFRESFEDGYGQTVSQYSDNGYVAAMVIEAALEAAGSSDPEALTEAIGQVEVEAPRGVTYFDEFGQAVYPVYIREAVEEDGRWVNRVLHTYEDVTQFWTYDPDEFMSGEPLAERRGTWAD